MKLLASWEECDFMKEKQFHNYLNKIFSKDEKIFEMISELDKNGKIFIFGGTVRNFFENEKIFQMPRDVDIVFKSENGNKKNLENIVLKYFEFSKNRFNGLKIKSDKLKIDIWNFEDTWAFSSGTVVPKTENFAFELSKTVFLNIDAAVYDFGEKKFYIEEFEKIKKTKTLDILIEKNPFIELNLLRGLIFKKKYNLQFSKKMEKIFRKFISDNENYVQIFYSLFFLRYSDKKEEWKFIEEELRKI